jgi:hypothetical protein
MLDQNQIPAELPEALEGPLSFCQSLKEQDKLPMPGE